MTHRVVQYDPRIDAAPCVASRFVKTSCATEQKPRLTARQELALLVVVYVVLCGSLIFAAIRLMERIGQ